MLGATPTPLSGFARRNAHFVQKLVTALLPDRDASFRGALLRAVLLAIAVFAMASIGLALDRESGRIAIVWLANGVAIAALLRCARGEWPLLSGAALIANVAANLVAGDALLAAALLALLNGLEIMTVSAIAGRSFAPRDQFERLAVGRFVGAALIGPLAPSVLSAAWFALHDGLPPLTAFIRWYGTDVLGLMIVTPILLALRSARAAPGRWMGETWLIPLLATGLAALVFGQQGRPLMFLLTPIVLLAAFRLRLFAAMVTVAAVATVAILLSARGLGPVAGSKLPVVEQIYVLQAFLATLVTLVLPVAAVIGERDRLGLAADHSERLFHRIAQATPAGILHVELDGTVSFANDRWVQITADRPASLATDDWLAAFAPEDRPLARRSWQQASQLHEPKGGDIRVVGADGTVRWAEYNVVPELAAGRLNGFVVKLFDVSHGRAVEQALHESESLYRLIAENSSDVILRLTLDGTICFVSNAATRLFGFDPADLVERPIARFIHPDDMDALRSLFPAANDGRGEISAQFRHRRHNGDYLWIEASARTTIDPATGEPSEMIVSLRDISVRRRSEAIASEAAAKLRESNRLLTLAESLMHVGHWRFDVATQGYDCSPQVNLIVDIARGQPIGPAEIFHQIHPDDRRPLVRALVRASRQRAPVQQLARLNLHDEVRHICIVAQAEHGSSGALSGLFGVIQDVTEDEIAQAELIRARDEAQAAARAKSDFLATMSHEIRTPMTGVLGMIDLLRDNPPADMRERYFVTLKQSADMLMTVLDDVLDFSRIESGRVVFEEADFDIEELMQSTIDLFDGAASQKGLLLGFEGDRGAPTAVRGDAIRLQQVVSNLISNAIKFTANGRVTLLLSSRPVDASLPLGPQNWRIEVRDTGIGIPSDKLGSLFEPFVQAEAATSRRFGGTGLGLAISRRLIDAMGGKAGVRSRPGRGSTFWVELALPAGSGIERVTAPLADAVGSRALDVLVAEDNPINQMIIGAILRRLGHHVACVENGRLALARASSHRFDVILMDMQMPEMDGLAATREIRNLPGALGLVPIIALTADASSERRRFYDGAGLTDFLTKPIDRLALAGRLAAIAGEIERGGNPPGATKGREDALVPVVPGPMAEEQGDAPFDAARTRELREALGVAQVGALLEMLATELDRSPARIRQCIERGDYDAARAEAHSLKGAASNLGATALGRVAEAIEQAHAGCGFVPELMALDVQADRTVKAIAALR